MEETDTKITVSSINEINSFNMERVITIRGGLEEMSKAEAEIR
jgi:insulin-like growth factor 2 mRNA-binding protein 1